MKRKLFVARFALALIVWACPLLLAQETKGAGSITIVVRDQSGIFVRNAEIKLLPLPTDASKSMTTDEHGKVLLSLPEGSYKVSVTAPGFSPWRGHILVRNKTDQTAEVVLKVDGCPPGPCPTVYSIAPSQEK